MRVDPNDVADIYVFNTCSVTENADKKFKNLVRKVNKLNKNAFIAVIGCYAQLKTHQISKINGVDLVLGASEKFNLDLFINKKNKAKFLKHTPVQLILLKTLILVFLIKIHQNSFIFKNSRWMQLHMFILYYSLCKRKKQK